MSKRLLSAFATQEPERFAELLGASGDVNSTLAILTDIPDGMECDVVARLAPEAIERLLNGLADPVLVRWLESAPLDAGRRLLSHISDERSTRLINGVSDRPKRRGLRRLAGYPAKSIGALVQSKLTAIKEDVPAADIGNEVRRQGDTSEGPIVIENSDGMLKGVLDLSRLMQNSDAPATAGDFCIPVRPVYPDSHYSTLEDPAAWAGMTSLPVVDHQGRPIGYVTRATFDTVTRAKGTDDPLLGSVVELSKRFWGVSAGLLVFILGRRAEH